MALNIPIVFSYGQAEPPSIAIVVIAPSGRRHTVDVILDSGAEGTLLDIEVAEALRLDLTNARTISISGVGGAGGEARIVELDVELLGRGDLAGRITVAFASDVADTFGNLLGLNALSHFDLGLQHSIRRGYLGTAGGA